MDLILTTLQRGEITLGSARRLAAPSSMINLWLLPRSSNEPAWAGRDGELPGPLAAWLRALQKGLHHLLLWLAVCKDACKCLERNPKSRRVQLSPPAPWLGGKQEQCQQGPSPCLALPCLPFPFPCLSLLGSRAQGFVALAGEPGWKVAAEVGWLNDWLAQNSTYLFKKWKWGLISIYWLQLAYKSRSGTWRKEKDQAAT